MFNQTFRTSITALAACVLLAGCTTQPTYDTTTTDYIEAGWNLENSSDEQALQLSELTWLTYFTSSELKGLINQALAHNRDLRIAEANIAVAKANYGIQSANLYPTLSANAGMTRTGTPENLTSSGRETVSNRFQANLAMTAYEIDFFGKIASLEQAAVSQYLSTEKALQASQIVVVSNVANAYAQVLAAKQSLNVTERLLKSQQDSAELIQLRFDNGIASSLEVAQVNQLLATTQIQQTQSLNTLQKALNTLQLLVGSKVTIETQELDRPLTLTKPLPAELNSSVLLVRPDIQAAEYQLFAQDANLNAARLAYYPSISLTGLFGFASMNLNKLFTDEGFPAWSFGPSLNIPIFTAGQIGANINLITAQQSLAVANYEQAVQNAFKEVSDVLSDYRYLSEQKEATERLIEASTDAQRISQTRYEYGIDSYLAVLDAERTLLNAELQLVAINQSIATNQINIYKALGGGWEVETEQGMALSHAQSN
ncbi:MAG: efflux transporter outer membrane subunit [Pseudomonadota bacterium]|nr:efflux transporter outer membrane subunit [Pseudomonadota bacterium]